MSSGSGRVYLPQARLQRQPHPFVAISEAVAHAAWRKDALDAFESHSYTGFPGEVRWCSRCTHSLPVDWKNPAGPVPPTCGVKLAKAPDKPG